MSKQIVEKSEVAVSTATVAAEGDHVAAGSDKAAVGNEQLQEPVPEKRQRLSPRNDNIQQKVNRTKIVDLIKNKYYSIVNIEE